MDPTPGIDVARTPDDRFVDLPGWPYEPRYVTTSDGLRVAYVDEGVPDGPPVLLTHGEPTWGYLYRYMIPPLVDAGCRVVVPDLVGFGRSDKPVERDEYTYGRHVRWLTETIDAIGLGAGAGGTGGAAAGSAGGGGGGGGAGITMFCQDWGGLLGLVVAARRPEWFRGIVAANTAVPPGIDLPVDPDAGFPRWRTWSQEVVPFSASECVAGTDSPLNALGHTLTDDERRAYDAPFPDESFCAGARQFPLLVPLSATHPSAPLTRAAWERLGQLTVPVVCAFSAEDDVTGPARPLLEGGIPGAADQPHRTLRGAGHFLQEVLHAECVEVILDLMDRTG